MHQIDDGLLQYLMNMLNVNGEMSYETTADLLKTLKDIV